MFLRKQVKGTGGKSDGVENVCYEDAETTGALKLFTDFINLESRKNNIFPEISHMQVFLLSLGIEICYLYYAYGPRNPKLKH